jgi:hypothetical protein
MDRYNVIALLVAFVALAITYFHLRHSRFALAVDIILKYEERFDEQGMRAARAAAAEALKAGTESPELEDVLGFFETIGLLVRRRAVTVEFASNTFAFWVLRYWQLAKSRVEARREAESDSTLFENVEYLVDRFKKVERRSSSPTSFSDEQLSRFLEEELLS